jgi:GH15 family glucan-1,4-alpha-glucosidase
MPRSLVLGNGQIVATFDNRLQMRDFYYPYVGLEDHTTYGHVHRVGVFVEGRGFSWFSDPEWSIEPRYAPETLAGDSVLRNEKLGIEIGACDEVHPVYNILLRHFTIRNLREGSVLVKLFFHHDFYLYGDKQKDTAFYEPYTNTVIHYREKRYMLVGGQTTDPDVCSTGARGGRYASALKSREELQTCGISSFTVGKANYRGLEGTWKDAEDGELSRNPIEQGSVDSTIAINSVVNHDKPTEVQLWLCAGKGLDEVLELHQTVLTETPDSLHRNCHNYWKSWVNKKKTDFGSLPREIVDLYKRSLLITRTHVDSHGGILAAADSDIMAFNRDTYTYVWPRDGAFVSLALDKAGYQEVTREFFRFCAKVQQPDGYVLHKYNPDGSVGSSWHPWFYDNEAQLPIQEDETALVIYAILKHFQSVNDFEFLQEMYEGFVKRAASFLCDFREPDTGLPLPSYDPWEEHRGVFTYTTASVIAGLHAAAEICHILGHHNHSERYQAAADEVRQALLFHLYDEKLGRFLKCIKRKNGQTIGRDENPDASIMAIWKLGVLPPDDPRVVSTMEQLHSALTLTTGIGGMARYVNDFYHSAIHPSKEVPGNPWVLTTLWEAQWHIAKAKKLVDLVPARKALDWTVKYASPTGILAEQLHPTTGAHLSVAPLTWSHATFVETVLLFAEKEKELK